MMSPGQSGRQKPGTPRRPTQRAPNAKPPEEQALLRELWHISHFGWIPEPAIRRSLTIASGREIPAAALTERLRQLLKCAWTEQRHGDAGTGAREWRLTDSGRNAR
jgi:hypothetical protein